MTSLGGNPANANGLAHLSDGELAGYLDHELPPDERRRVETHIDQCAACRGEMIALSRITPARAAVGKVRAHRARWWMPAAAAAIVAALALPRLTRHSAVPDSTMRAPRVADTDGRPRIAIVSPSNDSSVAARLTFEWHAAKADGYRIAVLTDDGALVWETDTNDTTIALPASISLQPGRKYFWRVDAIGRGITASTDYHRLTIAPR